VTAKNEQTNKCPKYSPLDGHFRMVSSSLEDSADYFEIDREK